MSSAVELHSEPDVIELCTLPGVDPAAAIAALRPLVGEAAGAGEADAERLAAHLVSLARTYSTEPFTPLEAARHGLGVERPEFRRLLDAFGRIPQLRTAVERGPAGKYWTNTVLPVERTGALDAALHGKPAFPNSVGLYPGPTCMFRCHFCVRVTGAKYEASSVAGGNEMFASIIDEVPLDNPQLMYLSGGLEPLTNPGLGELITRAARRGLKLTLYTNSFALTEQTLARQPGIWDVHAIRTSLYGLNDEEYQATTTKRAAFSRVKKNLLRFQELRRERPDAPRLGFSYIILPGRAHRLLDLVDYIAELNAAAPDRPLEFLTLREDYSGRPDGKLPAAERARMQEALAAFDEKVRTHTPTLYVDYGYALESQRMGVDAELLRIRPETMRPTAHPQVAVQVDLLGDVYLYREAGFPDLKGAHRYIAGRVTPDTSLAEVVERFVAERREVEPMPGDEYFLDGYDQVINARLNQMTADVADGWADVRGFLR